MKFSTVTHTNLNIKINRTKKASSEVYNFKKADSRPTKIKTALLSYVEDQWTKFKDGILKIINKYIPTKTLKNKIDVPCMTTDIKRLLKKNKGYQKFTYKRKKSTKLKQRLEKISDSLRYKLKDAYSSYLTEMLESKDKK